MAISISLMFGRLGAVSGSNAAALLLDDYCEMSFYLSGSILIGNFSVYSNFRSLNFKIRFP